MTKYIKYSPLLLDPEYEYLRPRCYAHVTGYWLYRKQWLHRYLLDAPKGTDVDHINHMVGDNRKANLRLCTRSQNMMNTHAHTDNLYSNTKGVSYLKSGDRTKRWRARVYLNGVEHHCGYYLTEAEAVLAAQTGYASLHEKEFHLFHKSA